MQLAKDRWTEQCVICGREIDVGFWTKDRHICAVCKIEGELDPGLSPDAGLFGVGDKLPDPSQAPLSYSQRSPETHLEKLRRWHKEDHDWMMEHEYWGKHPRDR